MTSVLLGLGSNQNRHANLSDALDALAQAFGSIRVSRVFESEAVGCTGDNYFNLAVAIDTDWPLAELSSWLKCLEDSFGRIRRGKPVEQPLDIDILTYGEQVGRFDKVQLPRAEILRNAFVLWPLAELVPDVAHPVEKQTFAELWHSYDSTQKLWPIHFEWQGRAISAPDNSSQGAAAG
ncbi:2-amino-4-hydroxy-6-hydroxymethyldihydropteridine diphosphokinase [Marinobacterium mangrovicola]|uniref:2-amino-4-hydroxy-6-hydroxymethyldihydropteridine diphosphokinase n=1 Tax=Marinobacterium mangrovicola TaxID=1476959 RepID=A0A4R1GIY0_9GAMM|nr:2-amino-4-hydroxy-6-hydroxymethyldihydropteridine diphosphokinase [Marinobacterium mangrovicola]TCK07141.1 2-amino-4-hydroxy-6-hydroxymethyldihydropteridine diphosphokinase [Marinobacterium mangrovicola]